MEEYVQRRGCACLVPSWTPWEGPANPAGQCQMDVCWALQMASFTAFTSDNSQGPSP